MNLSDLKILLLSHKFFLAFQLFQTEAASPGKNTFTASICPVGFKPTALPGLAGHAAKFSDKR